MNAREDEARMRVTSRAVIEKEAGGPTAARERPGARDDGRAGAEPPSSFRRAVGQATVCAAESHLAPADDVVASASDASERVLNEEQRIY